MSRKKLPRPKHPLARKIYDVKGNLSLAELAALLEKHKHPVPVRTLKGWLEGRTPARYYVLTLTPALDEIARSVGK